MKMNESNMFLIYFKCLGQRKGLSQVSFIKLEKQCFREKMPLYENSNKSSLGQIKIWTPSGNPRPYVYRLNE